MFGEPRRWARRRRRLVDALWLTPLALTCLISVLYYDRPDGSAWPETSVGTVGYVLLTVVLLAPLWWRADRPREVFAVVAGISLLQWLAGFDPIPANMSVLVALFAVAAGCAARWAVAAWLISELGLWLSLARFVDGGTGIANLKGFASASGFVITIAIAGIYVNTRRRYLESLEERAERAERERDQRTAIVAAAERARIARELHDVIAHHVSVMVVQADGAGYAIDGDPEQARAAVRTISATGRRVLAEMRRLVGVLREDDGSAEEYAPQPGLAQLEDLLRQVRASGLPVESSITGVPRDLPEGEQLVIYRVVQEALTNALKHGGPAASAVVEVEYRTGEVVVRVRDDGRGAAAPAGIGGHGLIGMRERVAMYGGAVEAGPRSGGGFQVTARLPVGRAA
ncbi:histidine kinase [Thermopolyspora sp. NPDC052614]|uniref:sensor histidine kinase n=1 Tax=Thermopolyspora sp. NPDC052614 TaxID=3155682 RepID=UPI00341D8AFF